MMKPSSIVLYVISDGTDDERDDGGHCHDEEKEQDENGKHSLERIIKTTTKDKKRK